MPTAIFAERFDQSKLPAVANIDCGSDVFGQMATAWIKCVDPADSALQSIAEYKTDVFLYRTEQGNELVGYGSLGTTTHTIKGRPVLLSIIPNVGLDKRFRGCPKGDAWQIRFAAQIMLDLMARAEDHPTEKLILFVHMNNVPAKKLYARLGFEDRGVPNPNTGYQKMVYALPARNSL